MKYLIPFIFFLTSQAFAGDSVFYFKSSAGDYIGGGQEVVITPEYPADFSINTSYQNSVSISVFSPYDLPYSQRQWWFLNFAAPNRVPLSVGGYEDAARFPFQNFDQAGLSLSGNGRGCNRLSGRFDILEIEYDSTGLNIIKFAADFEQSCETFMPPLYGSIRINSDIPISALIPGEIELLNPLNSDQCVEAESSEGALVKLKGKASQDGPSMNWSASSGEVSYGETFNLNIGVGDTEEVTLTVSDSNGSSRDTTRSYCVSDTVSPEIEIISPVSGQVFTGNDLKLEVRIDDLVDENIESYEVFVGKNMNVSLVDGYSSVKLAKDKDQELSETEITVKAKDRYGNESEKSVVVFEMHDLSE